MGLSVVFVSGPRRCGKSVVIRRMVDHLWTVKPHYIRMIAIGGDKATPKMPEAPPPDSGIASARAIEYDPENIFERLPEALSLIHRQDRYGSVVIEGDADPVLRCAYAYDHRLFVMPTPGSVEEVFRTSGDAAREFQRVLDDTAAFAEEIFGLFNDPRMDDPQPPEERIDLTATHLRHFLYTPLGEELATRMALQPAYHGLVESDVILINTSVPTGGTPDPECLRRIERLLDRLHASFATRRSESFQCDPNDPQDKVCKKLFKVLRPMCSPGR
jgi:hypothetical protein